MINLPAMQLASGTRLGPYEIVAPIGAGGMGEVFKARDTRLDRSVAIKILPTELAEDAGRKLRFEREAKTISQLNHPHICVLHDVGEIEISGKAGTKRVSYLVMELLDGETLADRLARGPLPLNDVLKYGAQIADALAKAHEQRVVHRDLKPGNIMLTRAGAKLLDFGLAKTTRQVIDIEGSTQLKPLTQEGSILGTFQYMAPEQLEGGEADERTDIFTFGAVLYEMATGKRAFQGRTRTSLIAAILNGQPQPLTELQPLSPPALDHVIAKCLEKDRAGRWHSAHDIAEELRWTAVSSSSTTTPGKARSPAIPVLLALLAVSTAAAIYFASRRDEPVMMRAAIPTEGKIGLDYYSGPPAFSPDGKTIAYSALAENGRRMIWLRPLDKDGAEPIAGTEDGETPFWSPDGKQIAFVADRRLKKVSRMGGDAEVLAPAATSGGTWNADGVILFASTVNGPIERISSTGGNPVPVTSLALRKHGAHRWPAFLPDGKHFLFLAIGEAGTGLASKTLFVGSLEGTEEPRQVTLSDSNGVHFDGFLLFVREGVLRAQRFDPSEAKVRGESISIAPVQLFAWSHAGLFDVSSNGLLIYQPQGSIDLSQLVMKARNGETIRTFGNPAYYWSPRLSNDGTRVAVDKGDDKTGEGDIWIIGSDGGSPTRVTFDQENETAPIWSPDQAGLSYTRFDGQYPGAIMLKPLAGGDVQVLFANPAHGLFATDWSHDGDYIACSRFGNKNSLGFDAVVYSLREKKLMDIAATQADEGAPQFSPDGKWIAYVSNETSRYEIYVQPFPPTGAKYQVSDAGGKSPRWRTPGEIIYQSLDNRITSVEVQTAPLLRTGPPKSLFAAETREGDFVGQYDVAPNGTILLNEIAQHESKPMALMIDWRRKVLRGK